MTRRAAWAGPVCLALLAAAPAAAQFADGDAAFRARDFAAASRLWRDEAERGAPEAWLGLALLADRGLGQAPDPAEAARLYRRAAEEGLAEAQFNLAVLLDAGTGVAADPEEALVWYARAALRGHPRAQFNLALLLADPAGPAPNPALAGRWFARAAETIPAAGNRAGAGLQGPLRPPRLLFAAVDGAVAELVWTAQPGPADAVFWVEAVRARPAAAATLAAQSVEENAARMFVGSDAGPVAFRVVQIDRAAEAYAASAWSVPEGVAPPEGRVRFELGPASPARGLVGLLAADLNGAGIWTEVVDRAPPGGTAVVYRHPQDRALAEQVAEALPLGVAADARLDPGAALGPGAVLVRIAG